MCVLFLAGRRNKKSNYLKNEIVRVHNASREAGVGSRQKRGEDGQLFMNTNSARE
jgi:hypothetical protein